MILVDTNILVDIAGPETQWRQKSIQALAQALNRAPLVVNAAIFAEFSLGFDNVSDCEDAVLQLRVGYRDIPLRGLFLAGRAFKTYRRRGGANTSPLPDFFIGGHAAAIGASILTRDLARYQTYFPEVAIVSP